MVYNKYIGIIGGTGTIGSIIVKYLLLNYHILAGCCNEIIRNKKYQIIYKQSDIIVSDLSITK